MSRAEHHIPKYRKHRASGQAVVTIAGRDYYLGPHGTQTSKRTYDRLISEWISSGRSSSFGTSSNDLTVVELLAAYWRANKGEINANHRFSIRSAFKALRNLYGVTNAADFSPRNLKALREYWLRENRWSRSYLNDQVKRIVAVWKWAASDGVLPAEIYQQLRLVPAIKSGKTTARETEPVRPIDEATVAQTLQHMGRIPADMVRVQLLTGARPAEVCELTPGMIDRSGEVWEANLDHHKTAHHGRKRIIYIGPEAQSILKPYLLRGADSYLFSPKEADRERRSAKHQTRVTPLSCGNRPGTNVVEDAKRLPGEKYTTNSYRRAIHYACDKAFPTPESLEGAALQQWKSKHRWSPNRLRHTTATKVRKAFGLDAAASILGHSEVGVTQVYAEQDRQRAIDVIKQIG